MFCLFAKTARFYSEPFSSKYISFCCVSISVIFLVLPTGDARKFCQQEYSNVNDSNQTVSWTDDDYLQSSIVFSKPNCLNNNGKSIKRICYNGSWIPENPPVCDRISTNQYCPDNFFEYKSFCVVNYYQNVAKSFILQNLKSTLGNTKNISLCHESFNKQNGDFVQKQCCSKTKTGIHGEQLSQNCNNASSFVILPHDHSFHSCPDNCISSELGSNKCFCKITGRSEQKLASVDSIAQKKILSRLAGKDLCKVDGITPTGINNSYTAIRKDFYGLTSNSSNCELVETIADASTFEAPAMELTFDDRNRKLTLIIENYKEISPSKYYALECFTNAGTEPIRYVQTREQHKNSKDYSVYDLKLEKYIGEYWCEAFSLNLTRIQSNRALAFNEKEGNEYSLRIIVQNVSSHFESSYNNILINSFQKQVISNIERVVDAEVRFMKYFFFNREKVDVLLHLTTSKQNDITQEYSYFSEQLDKLPNHFRVSEFRTVEYCLPDDISSQQSGEVLHWGLTQVWNTKLSDKLCFQDDHKPVMRTCQGDFDSGTHWSELTGVCSDNITIPPLTKFLHKNLNANISSDLVDNITSITYNDSLTYVDIYLYGELIKRVEEDHKSKMLEHIYKIISNLSRKKETELESSQLMFNATDNLLLILDNESSSSNIPSNETYIYVDENILIKSANPFETNISGLYLLGRSDSPLNEMQIFSLKRNESIEDLVQDVDQVALVVNVPETILQNIEADNSNVSSVQVIFTVFYNDSLFVDSEQEAVSKVVSVVIPGYGTYLNEPIPIVMRSKIKTGASCGYWNLGQTIQRRRGQWSSFGGKYSGNFLNNSDLHLCHFSHLTHFALLIVSERIKVDEGDKETVDFLIADETSFHLTVITIIGTAFSFVGVLGIYLTALLFRQWREKEGTKILLNLSTAIIGEIVFLQFSGVNDLYSDNKCKLIGCLLHYTLLSKFCWMLIYAFLQYRRFVKVFGVAPKYLILKSIIFGWGLSALPVIITISVSSESYTKTNICYVHGLALYLAVLLPVFLIIITNLIIFIFVMYNVTTKKVESTIETKFSVLQLYLAILLFFVLGLPWLFAILAEFVTQNTLKAILMYLFCATGTLQGFILFVFYVLFNAETRQKWRKFLFTAQR